MTPPDKLAQTEQPQVRLVPPTDAAHALALVDDFRGKVIAALPETERDRLTALIELKRTGRAGKPSRAAEVANLASDAARSRKRADDFAAHARRMEEMTDAEFELYQEGQEEKQAQARAEWENRQRNKVSVSTSVEVEVNIDVPEEDLKRAGWHKHTDCGWSVDVEGEEWAGDDDASPDAIRQTLLDHHDRAHGLTSWDGCPHEPCRSLPVTFTHPVLAR